MTESQTSSQVDSTLARLDRADRRATNTYGLIATISFCLLVFGSNIPGPLMPIYRDELNLSTFTVTTLFAAYLAGLVATFTVIARTNLSRHSAIALPVALVISLLGDAAMLVGVDSVAWLFVGRLLVGVSVALGTGTAATLVLATRGERGRAIAASVTLLGSFLGMVVSAVIADFLPGPTTTIYYVHIVLLAVSGASLVTMHLRTREAVDLLVRGTGNTPASDVEEPSTAARYPQRLRLAGFGLGIAGWSIGGIVVALLPTVFRDMTGSQSIILTALGPIVLIGTACLAPVVVKHMRAPVTAVTIAFGAILCVLGVWADSLAISLLCCFVWGVGQGFAYNNGLKIVTAGLQPVDQGRTASLYASIAYGFNGVQSVLTGTIATGTDIVVGLAFTAIVFVLLCGTTIALGFRRWPKTL